MLFAAGFGKRLRPLTLAVPKACLPMLDVPLASWGLRALQRIAPPVAVNVSHLGNQVEAELKRAAEPGPPPRFFHEPSEPHGTAGTLRELSPWLGARVVTWNADLISDVDPAEVLETHLRVGARATLAVKEVTDGADLEMESGRVSRFVDRRLEPGARGVRFIGVAVYERSALELIPADGPAGLGETVLLGLAGKGELGVHVHDGYAADVGSPSRYLSTSLHLLAGLAPALAEGWPGEVSEGSYYGPRTSVGEDASVSSAIILEGAMVEEGAVVRRAVVWPGQRVEAGSVVEDCVRAFGRNLA